MANPNAVLLPPLEDQNDSVLTALRALADPTRLKLLRVLEAAGELWDIHLYKKAGIDRLDGAYHIGVLRLAKIVEARRREEKRLCYDLTPYGRVVLGAARQMKR